MQQFTLVFLLFFMINWLAISIARAVQVKYSKFQNENALMSAMNNADKHSRRSHLFLFNIPINNSDWLDDYMQLRGKFLKNFL
jgi:hypothetical protein